VDAVSIATEGAFKPVQLHQADGTLDGYEIELSKYLCAHMKVECTIVVQNFDGMIPALNAGKFDAIISGMSATAQARRGHRLQRLIRLDRPGICDVQVERTRKPAAEGPGVLARQ
jgi:hypothetical protein